MFIWPLYFLSFDLQLLIPLWCLQFLFALFFLIFLRYINHLQKCKDTPFESCHVIFHWLSKRMTNQTTAFIDYRNVWPIRQQLLICSRLLDIPLRIYRRGNQKCKIQGHLHLCVHETKKNKTKNTTQYVLDTTFCKQTHIT